MSLAVALVGVAIGLFALIGTVFPFRAVGWVRAWHAPGRFFGAAVILRLALGTLFVLAAPETRTPRIVLALGVLSLASALAILAMGSSRLDRMVDWWLDRSPSMLAASFAMAALFGTFLVYAGW